MNLAFEHPLWLVLTASLVILVPLGLTWFTALARPRRWAATVLRVLLMAALAVTLAGLSRSTLTDRLAVVIVADVSPSVVQGAPAGPDASLSGIAGADGLTMRLSPLLGKHDLLGLVTFDGKPTPLRVPSSVRTPASSAVPAATGGSRIHAAIRLAAGLVPPDASGRVLLISDGLETDLGATFTPVGVPVDVLPIRYSLTDEVIVESLDTPPRAAGESIVAARVKLRASAAAAGVLRIFGDGVPLGSRRLALTEGETVERFDVPLGAGRVHRFRAVWEPDVRSPDGTTRYAGDTITENNAAESITLSPGAGRVLLVRRIGSADDPVEPSPLEAVLSAAGLPLETITAERTPDDAAAYQAYDAVVLEDVPAADVSDRAQNALSEFVREVGGGLVIVGGRHSFGAGGWRETPLETLFPVNLKLPDRLVTPDTATIFVLDNSGSMRRFVLGSTRTQQQVANDAAALAVGLLSASDELGVVTFNTRADVLVSLARNTNVEATRDRLRGIRPDGGTNIVAGMELAQRELARSKAKVRHMVVLSDGKSMNAERLPALADACREAGIKVSAIAVGDDADVVGLEEIARRGGGAYHFVFNPDQLPKVFVKTVKLVRSPLVREEPFTALVAQPSALWNLGDPPVLGGLALTSLKANPIVTTILLTPEGEPVLASGRAGLGNVLAFTSDASEWALSWHEWSGYRPFWTNAVRSVMRVSDEGGPTVEMLVREGKIRVRVGAGGGIGGPDASEPGPVGEMMIRLYGPSGSVVEAPGEMIDPDTFETEFDAAEAGSYVAVVRGGGTSAPVSAATTVAPASEFPQLSSDLERLNAIARASGGRVLSAADLRVETLFDRSGAEPRRSLIPWWPALLAWLPVLFLFDVACRRIAWDRWLARARPMQAARAAAVTADVSKAAVRSPAAASPALVLDDRDADRLREQARDRRRAARLRQDPVRPTSETSAAPNPASTDPGDSADPPEPGLLAAKRRARSRFDEADGAG